MPCPNLSKLLTAAASHFRKYSSICGGPKTGQCPNQNQNLSCPFKDKVALVTGGASGIGFSCCKSLLKNGCRGVTIADIDSKAGHQAITNLAEEFGGDRAVFIECDVKKSEMIDWAYKNTINSFNRIDIIVNSAGIMTEKHWEEEVLTNVNGPLVGNLLSFQYLSPTCLGNGGTIINISSTMGLTTFGGCPIYTMSHAGLLGLTRALGASEHAKELNLKFMALAVGFVDTPFVHKIVRSPPRCRFGKILKQEVNYHKWLNPDKVSEAMLTAVKDGESGSIWVVECDSDPYKIVIPCLELLKDKGGPTVCVCETPCKTDKPNKIPEIVKPKVEPPKKPAKVETKAKAQEKPKSEVTKAAKSKKEPPKKNHLKKKNPKTKKPEGTIKKKNPKAKKPEETNKKK